MLAAVSADSSRWLQSAPMCEIADAIHFGRPIATALAERTRDVAPATHTASSKKGQIGENYVELMLQTAFGGVSNVTRSGKSGDLQLVLYGRKIMVEVKNYASAVPTAEVHKMRRDIEHVQPHGAVFVSLASPISGMPSFSILYETAGGHAVPTVYVVSDSADIITTAVNIVVSLSAMADDASAQITTQVPIRQAVADLRAIATDVTSRVVKIATDLASCREPEIEHSTVYTNITAHPAAAKYTPDIRAYIDSIMEWSPCMPAETVWKLSARGYTHTQSGVRIDLLAIPAVAIPRVMIPSDKLVQLLDTLGDKIKVDRAVVITVCAETVPYIMDVLCPRREAVLEEPEWRISADSWFSARLPGAAPTQENQPSKSSALSDVSAESAIITAGSVIAPQSESEEVSCPPESAARVVSSDDGNTC